MRACRTLSGAIAFLVAQSLGAQSWGQNGIAVREIGGAGFLARKINNSAQVAGSLNDVASVYDANTGLLHYVADAGAGKSYATDINNVGQVVGYGYNSANTIARAFISDGGWTRDIGSLGGSSTFAFGINNVGQIVGYSFLPGDAALHAYIGDGVSLRDLGTFGGRYSNAHAINDRGTAVGYSYFPFDQLQHAYTSSGGTMTDLGAFGPGMYSVAGDINNAGLVVGAGETAMTPDGDLISYRAFVSDGTSLRDLGTLGGGDSSAGAISDAGYIGGYATDIANRFLGALWEQSDTGYSIYSLQELVNQRSGTDGWFFDSIQDISQDSRFILAYGGNTNTGARGYYVLDAGEAPVTATPEPSALLLLVTGFGMAGLWTFRRARA